MIRKSSCFTVLLMSAYSLSWAAPQPSPTVSLTPPVSGQASPAANVRPAQVANAAADGEPLAGPPQVDPAAPVRQVPLNFAQVAPPPGSMMLRGVQPFGQIEFGVRSDEVATRALLDLSYRPSPSLTPVESQLKIYLNEQLVGLVTITKEQLGKQMHTQLEIDPRFISDFNRLRFELIGHYTLVCENPASSTIWLDIGKESRLDLSLQRLPLQNQLAGLPEPFFDARDGGPLTLPVVFAREPGLIQQRAAAILASWFGTKAQWRGNDFPVLYNQLPLNNQHGVVFATNDHRPDFLQSLPPVNKPTVKIISPPNNPYQKLLLILGRNDDDLLTAVQGIAQGELLLRGDSATVEAVKLHAPRVAYDAPNWVRTDRSTTFGELIQYENQLRADGLQPAPIALTLNLPPDLFLVRARGIDMALTYRYTSPIQKDGSRLAVHLNNQFMQDYPLIPKDDRGSQLLHIPLIQGVQDSNRSLSIPALRLGVVNQMRFNFDYANTFIGGTVDGRCETVTSVDNHVVIDPNSTIDFSGYRHFIEMPSLRAFASAGFPYSRYADLAQTLVLVSDRPTRGQLTTLLNALGNIGAQTGYPALRVQIVSDWSKAQQTDADLLMIGDIPASLRDDSKIHLLVQAARSWMDKPVRQPMMNNDALPVSAEDRRAESRTSISANGPMGAIVGFQSPFYPQRSVVALLADTPQGWALLNETLKQSGKRSQIFGSATIIRASGINSLRVGETYYVGHLPWWERLWNALAGHPGWLALLSAGVVILFSVLVWRLMRMVSRRRLNDEDDDAQA